MKLALGLMMSVLVSGSFATAQTQSRDAELEQMRQRLQKLEDAMKQNTQALTDEVGNLKLGLAVPELAKESFYGMGAGASKVYYSKNPLSIGGYGEIYYRDVQGESNKTDMYRFVPYFGYRFNKNLVFNAEVEFEHGGAMGGKGEAIVEFAYLDFLIHETFNVRAGHVLVPVGLINMLHEPTYFPMVQRPEVENVIIPTTWHENGVLAFGNFGAFTYHAGLVNSPYAATYQNSNWIRSGRQKGAEARANDWGGVARLDYEGVPGLLVGASVFHGDTSQDEAGLGNATVNLYEVHAMYRLKGLELSALYTAGTLGDIDAVNAKTAAGNGQNIGSRVNGYYAIASYDVLPHFVEGTEAALPIFIAYEKYNLHEEVGTGKTANANLNKNLTSIGFNYRPISNVAVKTAYQIRKNEGTGEADRLEFGLGWVF